MDIAAPAGEPFSFEGHLIFLDRGMGMKSALLHARALAVSEGMSLRQGQVIGQVGMTGRVTGPHCHWGLTCYGHRLDPAPVSGVIFACAADPEFERIAPQNGLLAIFWLIIDQGIVIKLQKRQFPPEITDWPKSQILFVSDRLKSSCFWVPA